jgi:hypothetical protein
MKQAYSCLTSYAGWLMWLTDPAGGVDAVGVVEAAEIVEACSASGSRRQMMSRMERATAMRSAGSARRGLLDRHLIVGQQGDEVCRNSRVADESASYYKEMTG